MKTKPSPPKIITRKEALSLGLRRYYSGRPCIHGHISERYVCNNHCIACTKMTLAPRNKPVDVIYKEDGSIGESHELTQQELMEEMLRVIALTILIAVVLFALMFLTKS